MYEIQAAASMTWINSTPRVVVSVFLKSNKRMPPGRPDLTLVLVLYTVYLVYEFLIPGTYQQTVRVTGTVHTNFVLSGCAKM